MSILVTQLINDVKQDFEGGASLSVDWDILVRRAVETVMDNLTPETGKRSVPIYGGLLQNINKYYCPSDVLVPSSLYDNDGQFNTGESGNRPFTYKPPKAFYASLDNNTYTIETVNGAQFVIVRKNSTSTVFIVDTMDSLGTNLGTAPNPTLNTHNFLTGSGAFQTTFTDAGLDLEYAFDSTQDLSAYDHATIIVPVKFKNAVNIASLEFKLLTDDSNYFSVISTSDSVGDYFADGWNMVRFELQNSVPTASPSLGTITKWSLKITTTTGETEVVIIDKITIQKSIPYYFEYYSNKLFLDGTTGARKTTCSEASGDSIDVNRDVAGILHYELAMLVTQSATFDAVDGQATKRIEGQLGRKYENYYRKHPSSEAPLSYSISPDIDKSNTGLNGELQDTTESIT